MGIQQSLNSHQGLELALVQVGRQSLLPLFLAAELHDGHLLELSGQNGYSIMKDVGVRAAGARIDLQRAFLTVLGTCSPAPADGVQLNTQSNGAGVMRNAGAPQLILSYFCVSDLNEIVAVSQEMRLRAVRSLDLQKLIPDRADARCTKKMKKECDHCDKQRTVFPRFRCRTCNKTDADGLYTVLRSQIRQHIKNSALFRGECTGCKVKKSHYANWTCKTCGKPTEYLVSKGEMETHFSIGKRMLEQ